MKKIFSKESWKNLSLGRVTFFVYGFILIFILITAMFEIMYPSELTTNFMIKNMNTSYSWMTIIICGGGLLLFFPAVIVGLFFANKASKSVGHCILKLLLLLVVIPAIITPFLIAANIVPTYKNLPTEHEFIIVNQQIEEVKDLDDLGKIAYSFSFNGGDTMTAEFRNQPKDYKLSATVEYDYDKNTGALVKKQVTYDQFGSNPLIIAFCLSGCILVILTFIYGARYNW